MREPLERRLQPIDPEDENALDAMTADARDRGRESANAATELWRSFDIHVSGRAAALLHRLGDLAISPLMAPPDQVADSRQVWALRTADAAERGLRKKVELRLIAALGDRRAVPPTAEPGAMDEMPLPRRVCDEAYLLLRKLSNLEETVEEYYMNERAFLRQADPERDLEIQNALRSRSFKDFFDDRSA